MEGLLIAAAIVLAGAVAGVVIYCAARAKLRSVTRDLFGTDTLKEAAAMQELELETTPRSLSAVTSLVLPQIKRDFPDFDLTEVKARTEELIRAWLQALQSGSAAGLAAYPGRLRGSAEQLIAQDRLNGVKRAYEEITVHRTEIAAYQRFENTRTVTIQTAAGYRGGELKEEDPPRMRQTRFTLELAYAQNREVFEEGVASQNCPNCGAPLNGAGVCPYCGLGVSELNTRAWVFMSLRED